MHLKRRGTPGKAPKHVRAWTPEEDQMLILLYAEFSAAEVARQIGRPLGGVERRITTLRKSNPGLLAKQRPFTLEEEHFIRQNCKTMTVEQVAESLHRKRGDVIQKALRMKISFFKCGDAHHSTRISDADVQLIRELRDDEHGARLTFAEIAEKFDITEHAAWRIYNYRLTAADCVSRELVSK
ncbi:MULTISPECIES: AsnC family protein [unclassified Citrobacter]|uniref:AsnC family protein n=1 Tax=unclassified Citrobacter TaxID=2644389 RepID=UPI002302CFDD|nr:MULTISPECIES: AsnC family protein [unclassified Citrobacter]MDA8501582.1 AsnC family protein [Citrobacter sp. Awk 2]MDM2924408.1 AsnC family protein [Citrobacter sp. Cpa228]